MVKLVEQYWEMEECLLTADSSWLVYQALPELGLPAGYHLKPCPPKFQYYKYYIKQNQIDAVYVAQFHALAIDGKLCAIHGPTANDGRIYPASMAPSQVNLPQSGRIGSDSQGLLRLGTVLINLCFVSINPNL